MDVQLVRNALNQEIGKILEHFNSHDNQVGVAIQTGIRSLRYTNIDNEFNQLKLHYDPALLTQILNSHKISESELQTSAILVAKLRAEGNKEAIEEELAGLPDYVQQAIFSLADNVELKAEEISFSHKLPSFSDVKKEVKDALILSQLGELTLQAKERAAYHNNLPGLKEHILPDLLYDFVIVGNLARQEIGEISNEPEYLVVSKAILHLADLFDGVIKLVPKAKNDPNIIEGLKLLELLAFRIFSLSVKKLHEVGNIDAANKINIIVKDIEEKLQNNQSSTINSETAIMFIENILRDMGNILSAESILDTKEYADFNHLISQRANQILVHNKDFVLRELI